MCGVAGFLEAVPGQPGDRLCHDVQAMAACLRHRGPDDAGVWGDAAAGVALGFQRLAILDLTETGRQPMTSHDGRLVVVFNGEIYNHLELRAQLAAAGGDVAWVGHSDTETLLAACAAWGVTAALQRLVGMFAFALWDRHARRLSLARDRFGEKPLYYGWTRGAFVFGSELDALRRYPGFDNPIDRDVLGLYLQYSHVPAPYSIYRHVYKLEPGCVLSLAAEDAAGGPAAPLFAPARHGGLVLDRYWSLADVAWRGQTAPLRDGREALDRLEAALADAVRLQSIADVPLGAFLSGGVDSSIIVALMQAQSGAQVRTFTIGFHEPRFDEAPYARAVARHLGTDHTEVYISPQEAREVIPQLPLIYSEPFADASQIPTYLVSRTARRHVTVALSGDGGDELFGGYPRHYRWPRLWRRLERVPAGVRRGIGAAIARVPFVLGGRSHKLAGWLHYGDDVPALYRAVVTTWPPESAVVPGARPLPTVLDALLASPNGLGPEHDMMLWDALTYMTDEILHKVDRAAMSVSLETRAPILDHRVAELAWRLPLEMKVRHGEGKWILRQLLDRYVPRPLVERPKKGFDVPIETWLRGPLRDWAEDLLSESTLRAAGYLDPIAVRGAWAEHLAGRQNRRRQLWAVLMFQAWLSRAPRQPPGA